MPPMMDLADLIGDSASMRALRTNMERVLSLTGKARRLPPVLIQGETGTGKGLLAELLHRAGIRSSGPFISVNCAAIPESLLEAELFGYEPGAFTDAKKRKMGLFQAANGGVLFLDEVGLLPEGPQAKLLTAIEERRIRRLGGTANEAIDVWVIAATNTDLTEAVRARTFREDLYHRLAVIELRLPPLRERQADILRLAQHFLARMSTDYGLPPRKLVPAAEEKLLTHPWQGNVRELANVIERATLMTNETSIGPADLELAEPIGRSYPPRPLRKDTAERRELQAALEDTDGNVTQTAARLGITRNTVRARMERYGLARGGREVSLEPPARPQPASVSSESHLVPAVLHRTRLVEWERRRVALLRVTLGPDDLEPFAVTEELESIVEKVLGFAGRIEGIQHRSVDASFGATPADDTARRAVNTALAIQRSLAQQRGRSLVEYSCSLALHTAQVMVVRVGGLVQIDEADKAAARSVLDELIGAAPSEAILVSAELAPFLGRYFELARESTGGRATSQSYRVVGLDPSGVGAWRRLSPFVGREHELALLRQRWDQAVQGSGQLVDIIGDPGIGKSRLVWEFLKHCSESGRVLKTVVTPIDTGSPHLAVGELIRSLFIRGEGTGPLPERVGALLQDLELTPSTVMAPILELLGHPSPEWLRLDPVRRRKQLSTAVTCVLTALSVRSPLALVVEDAQWMDPESLSVIAAMVETLPTLRMLLLVTHRPEYLTPWRSAANFAELRLGPLSSEGATELLDVLIGHDASVATLKPLMASRTGGNPLFLEESVRTLVEGGVLEGEMAAYRLARLISTLDVPSTVEGVLEERIDRLAPVDKVILHSMAVAGVEIELGILSKLVEVDEEALHKALARLHAAEFIYQSHAAPAPAFAFKHALTHEVAYRMLAPNRGRELHAAVLAVGEQFYADQADEKADWLAFHALQGEMWSSAVSHLRRAAVRAVARAANRVAAEHLEKALGVLDRLPPSREHTGLAIDLRIGLRHALTPLGLVQRTLEHLRAAEALAVELGDPSRLGRVVAFIANCLVLQGRYGEALATGARALEIARGLVDHPMQMACKMYIARARLSRGEYGTAIELFQEILRSLEERPVDAFLGLPVLPAAWVGSSLASSLAELGAFAEAEAQAREAVRRADVSEQPDSVMWAYRGLGVVALLRGHADEAVRVFDRVLGLCRAHDLDAYVSRAIASLGCAKVRVGQVAEGLALLEEAVSLDASAEPRTTYTLALTGLAEAHAVAGHRQKALASALEALERARRHGERGAEGYALWVLARTESAGAGDVERAERSFQASAAIATELHLRPLLAHCNLGLAELYEAAGTRMDADEHGKRGRQLIDALGMQPWLPSRPATHE